MLSSRFAGIPISSSIIDGSGVPQLMNRGEQTLTAVTGSGGRLHFGMVAGIKSERWPTSNRNPRPDCVGIRTKVFRNCLDLLRRGDIDFFALMQRAQRSLDCEIGGDETAFEPLFAGLIECPWRSWLWPQQPGQASPKGAYVWQVYASPPRGHSHYGVYTVTKVEAEAALCASDPSLRFVTHDDFVKHPEEALSA
jgi:hypothetical protein